ncbi:NAD dependent epimerase/dehydratase [Aspergillus uvarum CBS 121591]|uniref:NAD dependent epimerase/dehydratase n=1 Tax=Aspergillus uvarum CBS 121591 TaxID=1448315 RepID=A0A319CVZ4_9EURO|nr:NAD dependent epimerase/dehydratase [Aspergillus uvarum CBS 121591]PYH83053.1 NAD dependent epimerase/dehydratase [Aspergillus uvarum CBS 121591]
MTQTKLLLTGATGFIGGTVLHQLLELAETQLAKLSITAAVRRPEQADLLTSKGVQTTLVSGLDDADGLARAASSHDIVVNVATGFHVAATKALIQGLSKRREQTGHDVHFLHLSGTTCVSVPSITPSSFELRTFSDQDDDIFNYEQTRDSQEAYAQRTAEITAIQTSESLGVKAYVVMPPLVYGRGSGWFKNQSHQIPALIRNAIASGYAEHVDTGEAKLGHVHVEDLARLYVTLVARILSGEEIPFGRNGYYFANTGSHKWVDVTSRIGKAGFDLGVLRSASPRSISLRDAAEKLADGNVGYAEACFASNSSTRSHKAFAIGWKPLKTEHDWEHSIKSTFEDILQEQ